MFAAVAGRIGSPAEFANHLAFLLLDLSDPEFRQITHECAAAVEAAMTAPGDGLPRAVHAAYTGALITWA